MESGVKYVKGNFLPTRTFRDLTDLNEQARRWVLEEAGVRIHGTTRQQPLERFLVEKPLMRPLPRCAAGSGYLASPEVASRLPRQIRLRAVFGAFHTRR